eukprot:TRINITY_DN5173_c0_g1_i1.p1 TRINITY_DN5173_c0_g1~~TRINITY_DN5173_c0_g1_i1.p1  ORF type:complete len:105 (+),score=14.33 TRINITY_DN5173_c0_g1_i1:103-417(+)
MKSTLFFLSLNLILLVSTEIHGKSINMDTHQIQKRSPKPITGFVPLDLALLAGAVGLKGLLFGKFLDGGNRNSNTNNNNIVITSDTRTNSYQGYRGYGGYRRRG